MTKLSVLIFKIIISTNLMHDPFEMGQFRGEVDRRVQGLQPLLIMIMGTILIWVVISILLPIYDQMNVSGIQ